VPANHLQAEDRCYRLGQTESVTVEYLLGDGTLDGYIASLLDAKMALKCFCMSWSPRIVT
jgi:SNF2 family DNA or RNA helicase